LSSCTSVFMRAAISPMRMARTCLWLALLLIPSFGQTSEAKADGASEVRVFRLGARTLITFPNYMYFLPNAAALELEAEIGPYFRLSAGPTLTYLAQPGDGDVDACMDELWWAAGGGVTAVYPRPFPDALSQLDSVSLELSFRPAVVRCTKCLPASGGDKSSVKRTEAYGLAITLGGRSRPWGKLGIEWQLGAGYSPFSTLDSCHVYVSDSSLGLDAEAVSFFPWYVIWSAGLFWHTEL